MRLSLVTDRTQDGLVGLHADELHDSPSSLSRSSSRGASPRPAGSSATIEF
jgi:hypothetical protein